MEISIEQKFTTERLSFEPLTVAHARLLFSSLSDPHVNEHLGSGPISLSDMESDFYRRVIGPPPERQNERWVNFAVRESGTGAFIGRVEATCYDTWCEVGYLFGHDWWGDKDTLQKR